MAAGPRPGSTPISMPITHADQAVEQVLRLGDDAEAVEEGVEVHGGLSQKQVGQRDAQPVEEQQVERGDGADADDDRAAPGLAAEEPQPHDAQQQRRGSRSR